MRVFHYHKTKRMVIPDALKVLRLQAGHKYCLLGKPSSKVGWNHYDTIKVGTEISFKLPMAASPVFEGMFREIESYMSRSSSSPETSSREDKNYLGIESYGISVTTLEEVFLRVARCDYDETDRLKHCDNVLSSASVASIASHNHVPKRIFDSKGLGNYNKVFGSITVIMERAFGLVAGTFLSFINLLGMLCCICCVSSTFWQHTKALFTKRAISARRDQKTIVFQLIIPAVFLLHGLLLLELKPHPDEQSIALTTSHFNPLLSGGGGGGPIPFDLSLPIQEEVR